MTQGFEELCGPTVLPLIGPTSVSAVAAAAAPAQANVAPAKVNAAAVFNFNFDFIIKVSLSDALILEGFASCTVRPVSGAAPQIQKQPAVATVSLAGIGVIIIRRLMVQ